MSNVMNYSYATYSSSRLGVETVLDKSHRVFTKEKEII